MFQNDQYKYTAIPVAPDSGSKIPDAMVSVFLLGGYANTFITTFNGV